MTNQAKTMIVLALLLLIATAALKAAEQNGLLDGSIVTRAFMVFGGLIIVASGNVVPKQLKKQLANAEAERRRQVSLRIVGWSMTLAGLAVSVFWLAAPETIARPVSLFALGLAFLVTLSNVVACHRRSRISQA